MLYKSLSESYSSMFIKLKNEIKTLKRQNAELIKHSTVSKHVSILNI